MTNTCCLLKTFEQLRRVNVVQRGLFLALLAIASCLPRTAVSEEILDPESREVAFCAGVLEYAINWWLLQNNEGAARVMVMQSSRANVAIFSRYYADGQVHARYVSAFTQQARRAKSYLDANPDKVTPTIDNCMPPVHAMAKKESARRQLMWGKTFAEVEMQMTSDLFRKLGLSR